METIKIKFNCTPTERINADKKAKEATGGNCTLRERIIFGIQSEFGSDLGARNVEVDVQKYKHEFHTLPMNLVETMVHTNNPEASNTVVAYYNSSTQLLSIRPAFWSKRNEISNVIQRATGAKVISHQKRSGFRITNFEDEITK